MFEQKKITYKMKLLSSLAKVFQDEETGIPDGMSDVECSLG